ncbi:MAG: Rpn family recombination-promoting nuclease/putative transposase [Lachnospiraceae bacterium]|nr:Rpn family recombination-promoting nuclease/putative transposase [Lachnospiraceae bacterium]
MTNRIRLSRQLAGASGSIEITLKNDMLFHMVMARSERALKGLVCALKGLREEDVRSVRLLNPINYDEYLEKEVVVDTLVEMNNAEILNIELQIRRDKEWIKRSLLYLCRAYDNIKGEDKGYERLKPTTHIGILDHDLFPEHPEFYAKYLLTNVSNGNIYTSIFGMNVLSLNRIGLATEEDRNNKLDYWAKLFRAETWEELKSLAERSEAMSEVAEAMYRVSAEQHNQSILRARRKYEEIHATIVNARDRAEAERDAVVVKLDAAEAKLGAAEAKLGATEAKLSAAEEELARLKAELRAARGES